MISDHNVLDTIRFSESLGVISQRLNAARKDFFDPHDRIIILQDQVDTYPYIDSAGIKLIEIQKIINTVDISNCFILLITSNPDIASEIDFITRFYSIDPNPINFLQQPGDYKKETIRYPNTACKKLWNHLYLGPDGNVNPCCLANHRFPIGNINHNSIDDIIKSDKANEIRNWMIGGYRASACSPCYSLEDIGLASHRQRCDPANEKINITSLDIRINNICNFKCRMCSEYFSSSIQQETIELYGNNPVLGHEPVSLVRTSAADKKTWFDKIVPHLTNGLENIYFAGGEPLIAGEHYQILDYLIRSNHTALKISYNTNFSKLTYKHHKAIDYWNQFEDVMIGASIDASGRVAEYVRHGTIWSDIVGNIFSVKTLAPRVDLKITSTVSFLTIENLIALQTQWINEGLFEVNDFKLNSLTDPKYLSPAALPQHHKTRLSALIHDHIDWLGRTSLAQQWQNVLQLMTTSDYTHHLNDFRHRTRVLDQHRKESFLDVFPEFYDLYA